jgi:hypothetical protein
MSIFASRMLAKLIAKNDRATEIARRARDAESSLESSPTIARLTLRGTGQPSLIARRRIARSASDVGRPCPQPPQLLEPFAVASALRRSRFRALRLGITLNRLTQGIIYPQPPPILQKSGRIHARKKA